MKAFITAVMMVFAVIAQAQVEAAPADLGEAMKVMSGKLKLISAQAADPKLNVQSATLSDEFVVAVAVAKTFIPKSVLGLSAGDQPGAKDRYLKMMDQASAQGAQMAAAFRAGNTALATQVLNQLADTKKQGHSEFKH